MYIIKYEGILHSYSWITGEHVAIYQNYHPNSSKVTCEECPHTQKPTLKQNKIKQKIKLKLQQFINSYDFLIVA